MEKKIFIVIIMLGVLLICIRYGGEAYSKAKDVQQAQSQMNQGNEEQQAQSQTNQSNQVLSSVVNDKIRDDDKLQLWERMALFEKKHEFALRIIMGILAVIMIAEFILWFKRQ